MNHPAKGLDLDANSNSNQRDKLPVHIMKGTCLELASSKTLTCHSQIQMYLLQGKRQEKREVCRPYLLRAKMRRPPW
eukprot:scaffold110185_cov16-Tisochrysis_lutea.AAC.2